MVSEGDGGPGCDPPVALLPSLTPHNVSTLGVVVVEQGERVDVVAVHVVGELHTVLPPALQGRQENTVREDRV